VIESCSLPRRSTARCAGRDLAQRVILIRFTVYSPGLTAIKERAIRSPKAPAIMGGSNSDAVLDSGLEPGNFKPVKADRNMSSSAQCEAVVRVANPGRLKAVLAWLSQQSNALPHVL